MNTNSIFLKIEYKIKQCTNSDTALEKYHKAPTGSIEKKLWRNHYLELIKNQASCCTSLLTARSKFHEANSGRMNPIKKATCGIWGPIWIQLAKIEISNCTNSDTARKECPLYPLYNKEESLWSVRYLELVDIEARNCTDILIAKQT